MCTSHGCYENMPWNDVEFINEVALCTARDDMDDENIDHPSEYFNGYCLYNYDGLKQWARGGGLPLIIGGFGKTNEEIDKNKKKIEKCIISVVERFNALGEIEILKNQTASLLLKDCKPDPNGPVFYGDGYYTECQIVELTHLFQKKV